MLSININFINAVFLVSCIVCAASSRAEIVTEKVRMTAPVSDFASSSDGQAELLVSAYRSLIAEALKTIQRAAAAKTIMQCALKRKDMENVLSDLKPKFREKNGFYQLALRADVDVEMANNLIASCSSGTDRDISVVVVARRFDEKSGEYVPFDHHIENGFRQIFTSRGFNVVSDKEIEEDSGGVYQKDLLIDSYQKQGKVNWVSAIDAAAFEDIEYLALGTLDVNPTRTNPGCVKGQYCKRLAQVTANIEIANVFSKRVIESIEGMVEEGLGDTDSEAISVAVSRLINQAGSQLADGLAVRASESEDE